MPRARSSSCCPSAGERRPREHADAQEDPHAEDAHDPVPGARLRDPAGHRPDRPPGLDDEVRDRPEDRGAGRARPDALHLEVRLVSADGPVRAPLPRASPRLDAGVAVVDAGVDRRDGTVRPGQCRRHHPGLRHGHLLRRGQPRHRDRRLPARRARRVGTRVRVGRRGQQLPDRLPLHRRRAGAVSRRRAAVEPGVHDPGRLRAARRGRDADRGRATRRDAGARGACARRSSTRSSITCAGRARSRSCCSSCCTSSATTWPARC